MPEKTSKLTPLAAQKKLLLLESDLNRTQLLADAREWKAEVHRAREHFLSLGSMAATAAKVAATVSTAGRLFSRRNSDGKRSWVSTVIGGVTTGVSLWNLLHGRRSRS
jgi:hypothetical protein